MVPMQNCVQFGLASFTYLPNAQTEAVFSNVSITGGNGTLADDPGGWHAINRVPQKINRIPPTSLYPNPTNGLANLVFEEALEGETTILLRNQLGQVVEQRELRAGDYQTEWNVSALADGLYLFEIRQEGEEVQVLRLVKTN